LGPTIQAGIAAGAAVATGVGAYYAYKGYRKTRDIFEYYKSRYKQYRKELKEGIPSPQFPGGKGPAPIIPVVQEEKERLLKGIAGFLEWLMDWFKFLF
jgi:hypothetical protein